MGGAKNSHDKFPFYQSIKELKIIRSQTLIVALQEIFFSILLIIRHTTVIIFLKGGKQHGRRIHYFTYW